MAKARKRCREGPTRALGYCRVSTQEQGRSDLGLEAQRQSIRQECERRGWRLVGVHEDVVSGKATTGRPGLQEAVAQLGAGEAEVLISAKLDRLSRSVYDFVGLQIQAQREGWRILTLDLAVDTTTPQGEAMASMAATFAQLERRLIGERTKAALAVAKAQGVKLGRPQLLAAEVVDRIFRERRAGRSLQAIADGLMVDGIETAHGGVAWWPSTVRYVLQSAEKGAA